MSNTLQNILKLVRANPIAALVTIVLILIFINAVLAPVLFNPIFNSAPSTSELIDDTPFHLRIETELVEPFPVEGTIQIPYQGEGFIVSEIQRTEGGVPTVIEVYIISEEARENFLLWVNQFTMPGTAQAPVINYHQMIVSE